MYTILIISAAVSSFSFIPHIKSKHWSIRGFDFLKLQLTGLQILVAISAVLIFPLNHWIIWLSLGLIALAVFSNLKRILKFTPLKSVSVPKSKTKQKSIDLLTANVLQTNKQKDAFVELVKKTAPEMVLVLEVDRNWEHALIELKPFYPYHIAEPLENLYGISLYSKFPLKDAEIKHWVKKEIPSIKCTVDLGWKTFDFYGIHPEPPSPSESATSKDRDAELMRLASHIKDQPNTTLVSGDLNDVVWSSTTQVFMKESGLLDPRIGRGFYSTYNANYPSLLRFPVDQLFHSKDIHCAGLKTIRIEGSDHLGVLYGFTIQSEETERFEETALSEKENEILVESKARI